MSNSVKSIYLVNDNTLDINNYNAKYLIKILYKFEKEADPEIILSTFDDHKLSA